MRDGTTSPTEAGFRSAAEAGRLIAGVSAAARTVKALADGGASQIQLWLGDGRSLTPAALDEIERLRGNAAVTITSGIAPSHELPSAWEIVRATGKAGDGLVSRWLNRPISQRITTFLLGAVPAIRPIHITLINALLAVAMVPILVLGGEAGLIMGGILFHAASVLDGVDGEIARATWRSSPGGATLDSIIDIATNLLFVAGLTVNLALRDGDYIGWLGAYALVVSIIGGALLAWRGRARGGPIGFDLLKRREHRLRGPIDLIYWAVQTLTGRDCFAFLYMVLIIVGLERTALGIYAGVGTIWLPYVIVSVLLSRPWSPRPMAPILEPQPLKDSAA